MTYPTISAKLAEKYLDSLKAGHEPALDQFIVYRESIDSFGEQDAVQLHQSVEQVRSRYPEIIAPKSRHASQFEMEATPLIHAALGQGRPAEYCADPEFWTWLAIAHFLDVTKWRYGEDLKSANLGIGAPAENFIYRLWLRGEVVLQPDSDDPYELAKRGPSIDFWRSHIFRITYSNWRPFARALVRFQYPTLDGEARLERNAIRALAKRLTQIKSNQIFACLNDAEASSLIENEAQSLPS